MRLRPAWVALAGILLLAACASTPRGAGRRLTMRLEPPQLKPGVIVRVLASPEPGAEMAWVSGTVKVFGAPTLPFAWDPAYKAWVFKSVIPIFASVEPGVYEAKTWGEDKQGKRYEGELQVVVK